METSPDLRDSEDLRRRFVQRFETWLEDLLARPEPPMGIAADLLAELEPTAGMEMEEADCPVDMTGGDLFSLWSAVHALTQEVQKQGALLQKWIGDADSPKSTVKAEDSILCQQLTLRQRGLHQSALRALCGGDPLRAQALLAEAQRLHETDAGRRLGLLIEWWLATDPQTLT